MPQWMALPKQAWLKVMLHVDYADCTSVVIHFLSMINLNMHIP